MRNLTILISAALCGVATSALAQPQAAPAAATQQSADARLKVLYEAYSNWDQKESGYFEDSKGENQAAAYLAKVDPATQLARARFEQQMLDQLNAIPTSSLSPDERVNAGVLRAILEAAVADAKFRDWEMPFNSDSSLLDLSRSIAIRSTMPPSIGATSPGCATSRAISTSRSPTCAPAWRAASACRKRRSTAATRRSRPSSTDPPSKTPSTKRSNTCPRRSRAAEQEQLRAEGRRRDRAGGPARLSQAADLLSRRIYVRRRGRRSAARDLPQRRRFYRAQIREYTTTDLDARRRSTRSASRKSRASMPRCADDARERLQGLVPGVPAIPEDRPAVHRQDARRAAGRLGLCREADRREARRSISAYCRGGASRSSRCRTRSRPSTRRAAAGSRAA